MDDGKLKRVLDEIDKLKKENTPKSNANNVSSGDTTCSTYEALSTQLFNIHKGHLNLITEIRNKNADVVKQLIEHLEK